MADSKRTTNKTGKASSEALTVAIKRSVVRPGQFLIESHAEGVTDTSTIATLWIDGAAVDSSTIAASGDVVLEADIPKAAIGSVGVGLAADGEAVSLDECKEHYLRRFVSADFEAFRTNVMRKGFRIDDAGTLVEAARQSYLTFSHNLLIRAVSLAVVRYRHVEGPNGRSCGEVARVEVALNALREWIDGSIAEEARWATSIDMKLYQICILGDEYGPALLYSYRLCASRDLVDVEPVCAYNISLKIYLVCYLYFVAACYADAANMSAEYEGVFVKAVNGQRKSVGTMRELATVSGQTAAIRIAP